MYHGINIGEYNTYTDWKLVPTSRPVVAPPEPQYNFVEVPGMNGALDFTEALGGVAYRMREGKWKFLVEHDHPGYDWQRVYSDIMNAIHGKLVKVVLEDDPDYYYTGRVSVDEWRSDPDNSYITLTYQLSPYKLYQYGSLDDWLWDPLDFEYGVIYEYSDIEIDGMAVVTLAASGMPVTPAFIVSNSSGLTVEFKGNTYPLTDGTQRILNIQISGDDARLTFHGSGTVSIEYRGGKL